MSTARHAAAVVLVLLCSPLVPLSAQRGLSEQIAEIRRRSTSNDHVGAIALADSALATFPDFPTVVLFRGAALASAGRTADALAAVRRLLRWDPRFARRALEDSALMNLRSAPGLEDVVRLAARADVPIARASLHSIIPERDLVAEGTAYDPATAAVLVGSLNKHKIIAIAPDGSVSDRVPSASHGLRSVAGIHVDTTRRMLWAASNARYDQPSDTTRSALYAFDASTGTFRARYHPPGPGPHFLNDITTGPDGTVYVTDSRAGEVWTLRPRGTVLERFTAAGPSLSPNGITISSDGHHLFIADVDHVQVVALSGGGTWRLGVPDSISVASIDGLAFADGRLIAHHPQRYWRIARYTLDSAHRNITRQDWLEANTPDARTSTTGEVAGNRYVFIGNGQIDRMNVGTIDSAAMQPIRMYATPIARTSDGVVAVALSARDSVAIFNAITLERLTTLAAGDNPHEISASSDGRRAFVANAGDTTISVIEAGVAPRVAATWYLPDTIRVHDVEASGDGRTVWAASGGAAAGRRD